MYSKAKEWCAQFFFFFSPRNSAFSCTESSESERKSEWSNSGRNSWKIMLLWKPVPFFFFYVPSFYVCVCAHVFVCVCVCVCVEAGKSEARGYIPITFQGSLFCFFFFFNIVTRQQRINNKKRECPFLCFSPSFVFCFVFLLLSSLRNASGALSALSLSLSFPFFDRTDCTLSTQKEGVKLVSIEKSSIKLPFFLLLLLLLLSPYFVFVVVFATHLRSIRVCSC